MAATPIIDTDFEEYCDSCVWVKPVIKDDTTTIYGRLSIVRKGPNATLHLAWFPTSPSPTASSGSSYLPAAPSTPSHVSGGPDRDSYGLCLPLAEIASLRRQHVIGTGEYVIITLRSNICFPPFFFESGRVRSLIVALKSVCDVVKSEEDRKLFLINGESDKLRRSLSHLQVSSADEALEDDPDLEDDRRVNVLLDYGVWGALEGFSRVTTLARNSLSTLQALVAPYVGEDEGGGGSGGVAPLSNPTVATGTRHRPPPRTAMMRDEQQFSERGRRGSDSDDYGGDSVQRGSPPQVYTSERGEGGRGRSSEGGGGGGGGGSSGRTLPSGAFELLNTEEGELGDFDIVSDSDLAPSPMESGRRRSLPISRREDALQEEDWLRYMRADGHVGPEKEVRLAVFRRGLSSKGLRREVYAFLLGVYPFASTHAERAALEAKARSRYAALKKEWTSILPENEGNFPDFVENRHRVDKDVVRTDRDVSFYAGDNNPNIAALRSVLITYTTADTDLGYVQGMSDLCAPLLYLVDGDEALAYAYFERLMERVRSNFDRDQQGMHKQLAQLRRVLEVTDPILFEFFSRNDCINLYFCYRWILILYKREFSFEAIFGVWDAILSNAFTPHFHLYLAVGILYTHGEVLMREGSDFDEILKYVNGLSNQIGVDEAICRGEDAFRKHVSERAFASTGLTVVADASSGGGHLSSEDEVTAEEELKAVAEGDLSDWTQV